MTEPDTQLEARLVDTHDGSSTLIADGEFAGLLYHPHPDLGAITQARHVFAMPTKVGRNRPSVQVLDVGFGLGYNLAVALATYRAAVPMGSFEAVALDLETAPLEFDSYPRVPEDPDLSEAFDLIREMKRAGRVFLPGHLTLELLLGDARESLQALGLGVAAGQRPAFDCILHDPFPLTANPEMWTVETFALLRRVAAHDALLATVNTSPAVRNGMREAGWQVGGVLAIKNVELSLASPEGSAVPALDLDQLKALYASPDRFPYRDPELTASRQQIVTRRAELRAEALGETLSTLDNEVRDVAATTGSWPDLPQTSITLAGRGVAWTIGMVSRLWIQLGISLALILLVGGLVLWLWPRELQPKYQPGVPAELLSVETGLFDEDLSIPLIAFVDETHLAAATADDRIEYWSVAPTERLSTRLLSWGVRAGPGGYESLMEAPTAVQTQTRPQTQTQRQRLPGSGPLAESLPRAQTAPTTQKPPPDIAAFPLIVLDIVVRDQVVYVMRGTVPRVGTPRSGNPGIVEVSAWHPAGNRGWTVLREALGTPMPRGMSLDRAGNRLAITASREVFFFNLSASRTAQRVAQLVLSDSPPAAPNDADTVECPLRQRPWPEETGTNGRPSSPDRAGIATKLDDLSARREWLAEGHAGIHAIAFAHDDRTVAVAAGLPPRVWLWDRVIGQASGGWAMPAEEHSVSRMAFAADDRTLFVALHDIVYAYTLEPPAQPTTSTQSQPSAAVVQTQPQVSVIPAEAPTSDEGEGQAAFTWHESLAYRFQNFSWLDVDLHVTPTGERLFVFDQGGVRLWSLSDGEYLWAWGPGAAMQACRHGAVSPDGHWTALVVGEDLWIAPMERLSWYAQEVRLPGETFPTANQ